MRVIVRTDCPGAYVVESGDQYHDVYVGFDISLPRCSCPDEIYRPKAQGCKHYRAVLAHPNGTDE